jgi:transcriptional regulator with XRE-family HTH domain
MDTPTKDIRQLGDRVRRRRLSAGKSVRGLAAQAGVDATWLSRLERGLIGSPEPRTLYRLAQALGVEVINLYEQAGYGDGLPGFTPYLRAKYDLPEADIVQLRAHFELINERYQRKKENDHP